MKRRSARDLTQCGNPTPEDVTWAYWHIFSEKSDPNIFQEDGICIADDGGVSDICELDYFYQYWKSASVLIHAAINMYVMISTDFHAIFYIHDAKGDHSFLLTRYICSIISKEHEFSLPYAKLVPIMEMIVLVFLLGNIVLNIILILCPNKSGEHWEMVKWSRLSSLMYSKIPSIAKFSALRMLYYVTPTVVLSTLYREFFLCREHYARTSSVLGRIRAFRPLIYHVITTILCLIFGFDSFLVKYRMAAFYVMAEHVSVMTLLGAFTFLFQILGVVNLRTFAKERLFLFVFAGEDGDLQIEEKTRWEVWLCILTKRIYAEFGWFRGLVIMLGFDDYDFQKLVLDEGKR